MEEGRAYGRRPPGPVVRCRHSAIDPDDGSGAWECLTRRGSPSTASRRTAPSPMHWRRALLPVSAKEPLGLAAGRILLPNNRAVRAVTEAFVRASGSGLLLPRLIPIGDPGSRRTGWWRTGPDRGSPAAARHRPAGAVAAPGHDAAWRRAAAESLRLAADLDAHARRVADRGDCRRRALRDAVVQSDNLAAHWEKSLEKLQAHLRGLACIFWPISALIDLAERRNRLLRGLAARWPGRSAAWIHRCRGHYYRGPGRRGRCSHALRACPAG